MGIDQDKVILCDTKGVIYKGRTNGMNDYKERLAAETDARTLEDDIRSMAVREIENDLLGVLGLDSHKLIHTEPLSDRHPVGIGRGA